MSEQFLQVWFMPWAGLSKGLQIGPMTFWPFSAMAKGKIPDQSVREHLERYFSCYIDHQGNSVLIVADLVFWECVARELYAYGCIGDNVRVGVPAWQKLFPKEPPEIFESFLLSSHFGFNDAHRALGWLPKLRRKP